MKHILMGGLAALSIILLSGCQSVSNHVNTIEQYIEEEKPNLAIESFNKAMADSSLSEKGKERIKNKITPDLLASIEKVTEDYIHKKEDYELVSLILETYKNIDIPEVSGLIKQKEEELGPIHEARDKLAKGLEAIDNKQYVEGIQLLAQVARNTPEYEVAREEAQKARKTYFDETFEQSQRLFLNREYEEAYLLLNQLYVSFENTAVENKIEEFRLALLESKIAEADDFADENKYTEAFAILDHVEEIIGEDELITLKREDYTFMQTRFWDELLTAYEGQTTQYYDEFGAFTVVAPKDHSAEYVDIFPSETSFYPRLVVADGYSYLEVVAGFGDSDWLYLEAIAFLVDGEQFTWTVDYYSVMDDYDEYGVYEWMIIDESIQPMLLDDLRKIANSKNAVLRFQGNGYIEHIITDKEKEQIRLFLDLIEAFGTEIEFGPTV
ncbi:hypothetical protein SAMN05877753_102761 [Bacillus oleivorans]|uniref:Uncharacterized protein n=1 Tax=Bacillus oleivorans TaxID=1448271 RepID=A0A285CMV9_9BACI|nr:hypothetical protein [Bacillus oleivorans]SNX68851.1 hypothetical protein SAMN05877753_102761 [Bacillus oleivorans]